MKKLTTILAVFLCLQGTLAIASRQSDDRGFDPSGVWMGLHGPLTLMRAGDTLSFSYSAVFGSTAHICDGIGVAGFIGDGRWEYADEQGSVIFTTRNRQVTMSTGQGIASFCGSNWPGDSFGEDRWKPANAPISSWWTSPLCITHPISTTTIIPPMRRSSTPAMPPMLPM